MSFPAYDEYKDSGIEWLGEVPDHWKVVSIKWLSPVQRGASPRPIDDPKYFDDDGEYAWVRIADVSASEDGRLRETTQRLSELGSSLSVRIDPGEIFVSIAGTVGKPCISDIRACIHDGFVYFPHIEINRHFLFRIFEAGLCYGGLGKWGTQLNLNTDTVGSIRIPVPPDDELDGIVEFLDAETSKIDALVAQQRRLVELLKEKRQAVISHAVTKGLNPNAPMKPSGIKWLGDVPEHWEVIKLKRLGSIRYGIGEPPKYHDEGTPLIRATNVRSGVLTPVGLVFVNPDEIPEQRIVWLDAGDIIVVRSGAGTGDSAIMPNDYASAIAGFDMVLRLQHADPWFIQFILLSKYVKEGQIDIEKTRAAQPHLNAEELGNCDVVLPPEGEQVAIVEYLVDQTLRIDTLQAESERAIELLQERRTALISAAVTGKIDVREFAYQETA